MEPAIHTFGNRKYQSWKAHQIRLQVWNFTSGGCKEGVQCHQAQPSHGKGGPLPDDKLQTQRMNCPFSQPMDQSPKGQRPFGPQLPASTSVRNSKMLICSDSFNFYQLILILSFCSPLNYRLRKKPSPLWISNGISEQKASIEGWLRECGKGEKGEEQER